MKQKVFNREFFVEEGRKGGNIGGKKLKEKYGEEYFHKISKMGVNARKKKKGV